MTSAVEPLLGVTGIRKAFPGVLALDDVDFDLKRGEIHAVLGKNGAGKSTLIQIIAGILVADAGEVRLEGGALPLGDLSALNVATVFQESTIFPNLTIAENIFAGNEPSRDRRAGRRQLAAEHLARFGIAADPDAAITILSPAERKVIEIIRALERDCRILILDEPTATLSLNETSRLFELLRQAKAGGLAIIYISHRLEEIFQVADRVTVLRDGRVTRVSDVEDLDLEGLVAEIVGHGEKEAPVSAAVTRRDATAPVRLEIRGLTDGAGRFRDLSLEIRAGEIVGIGGLIGVGKTEFARAIFGAEPVAHGTILLDGAVVAPRSPAEAIGHGIVYVTEDRKHEGLFLDMTIEDNLCAPILRRFAGGWQMLSGRAMAAAARAAAAAVRVKATGVDQIVATLSGGNQQKVLIGRWLQLDPKVLIVDEPTVGVDVSAREEIYRLIQARADAGTAVLFISSELKELIENCDRIVAMHGGRIVSAFDAGAVSEQELMIAVAGEEANP